ncbi:Wax ester synthase/diacylglycerol acyltransferase 11-like protein [Drosera capensis]
MCQNYSFYSTPLSMEKTLRIRTKAHTTTAAKQANGRESSVHHDGGGGGRDGRREEVWTETTEADEPLSPCGRVYHTASLNTCILVIFGFATSLDVGFLKERMEKTLIRHPRLRSKLVLDTKNGEKERWVLINNFNLDDHVIVPELDPDMEKPDKFIEDYASDLSSTPVDLSKPLWEFHVLNVKTSNAESVGIFKIHHSLGDGISLVSLTLAASRKSSKPEDLPSIPTSMKPVSKSGKRSLYMYLVAIWSMLQLIWNTFVGITQLLATSLFLRDTNILIDNKKVNVHSKKKIVHRLISLDDIKLVKNETNTTVNDVVVGLTSAALSRYLRTTSHGEGSISAETDYSKKKIYLRANVAVNVREAVGIQDLADMMDKGSKCKWGNVTGCIFIPLHIAMEKDPLEYIRKAKLVIDKKKLSFDAKVTYYLILFGQKLLGLKLGARLMYGVASNTTLMFSSVVGPAEEIDFCGHRVAYITPTARTAQGHAPGVVIHFMSYTNKMSVAVCANQDMVPEPHKLLDEVEGSLRDMNKAVLERKLNRKGLD